LTEKKATSNKLQATSLELQAATFRALCIVASSGIVSAHQPKEKDMKVTVNTEWRRMEEPDSTLEFIISTALKAHGFTPGAVHVQGSWDEDKPKIPFSSGERLPHEEIAKI